MRTHALSYDYDVRMPAETYFENAKTRNPYIEIVFTMLKLFDIPKTLSACRNFAKIF